CHLLVTRGELLSQRFACRLRLSTGQVTQQRTGLSLMLLGQCLKDIDNFVIPTPLFRQRRILLTQRCPEPPRAIGNRAPPALEAALPQIPQHHPPGLLELALPAFY